MRAMITENIAITGASSGIGASLARSYARKGVSLGLFGRNVSRLADIAETCRELGAVVQTFALETTDHNGMRDALLRFDREHPVSLLIVNAGVTSGVMLDGSPECIAPTTEVMKINYEGALNSINPLLGPMKGRRAGHIVVVGSLAARPGLPSAPAYSASKAAIETYAFALAGSLRDSGVIVSIVSPGFVVSPMTDQIVGPKPFLISSEKAAAIIKKNLARKKLFIRFPGWLAFLAATSSFLPSTLVFAELRRLRFMVRPRRRL